MLDVKDQLADVLALDPPSEGLWPSLADPRIDVLIAMTPGRVATFGATGLANVTVPALFLIGTNDQVEGADDNAAFAYAHVGSPEKLLVEFESAAHYIFGNCPPFWVQGGFPFCFDQVWDMDRARDLVDYFTTAFLLAELKGDEAARAALAPDAVTFPGITYEAEGF